MRRLFVTALMALAIPAAAFAGTLKENMKAIGGFSKQISASVSDSSQNAVNADRAAQMNALFQEVFTQAEDGIANIPAEHKADALLDFQNLISQEIEFTAQLHQAFLANDNALAAEIYQKMISIKKEGHGKYED